MYYIFSVVFTLKYALTTPLLHMAVAGTIYYVRVEWAYAVRWGKKSRHGRLNLLERSIDFSCN